MMIPDGLDVMYRYVVCMFVPPSPFEAASTDDRIVVRRWETNLKSRKIACHGKFIFKMTCQYYAKYLANAVLYESDSKTVLILFLFRSL
jgi:hypothetical protein